MIRQLRELREYSDNSIDAKVEAICKEIGRTEEIYNLCIGFEQRMHWRNRISKLQTDIRTLKDIKKMNNKFRKS